MLLDTLVHPSLPITDIRTRIHGITENHIHGVQFTLRHAQAFLYNFCSDKTILVGQALHNDLKALRFIHR